MWEGRSKNKRNRNPATHTPTVHRASLYNSPSSSSCTTATDDTVTEPAPLDSLATTSWTALKFLGSTRYDCGVWRGRRPGARNNKEDEEVQNTAVMCVSFSLEKKRRRPRRAASATAQWQPAESHTPTQQSAA